MAFPVTHMLVPMLIVETYRRYFAARDAKGNVLFSKWYVFMAGFFGGMPDLDIAYGWLLNGGLDVTYHRSVTHTLLTPAILLVAGAVLLVLYMHYTRNGNRRARESWKGLRISYILLFIAALALSTHVVLDGLNGFSQWLYPFAANFYLPNIMPNKYMAAMIDGVLLFVWILYDEKYFYDILSFLGIKAKRKG
ncbi:metal-dependent hydrolase [Candidatus Woesearchaeota archaeon]|nr:metal-dependent hydrolase [Candidatus Woesearchaeota archaeon]